MHYLKTFFSDIVQALKLIFFATCIDTNYGFWTRGNFVKYQASNRPGKRSFKIMDWLINNNLFT